MDLTNREGWDLSVGFGYNDINGYDEITLVSNSIFCFLQSIYVYVYFGNFE